MGAQRPLILRNVDGSWNDMNVLWSLRVDIGYHTSGWWKNPDYERCYHLSISFPGGRNNKKLEHILNKFFGNNKRLLWCEPPYSEEGKKAGVYHYRLFCDENWQPIFPRGEVYSTQFTEMGWKSFSELHRII